MDKINHEKRLEISSQESRKQAFLKAQMECYLCGQALNTYVEYLPRTHFVVEKAQCHSCMTVVRVKNHTVQ